MLRPLYKRQHSHGRHSGWNEPLELCLKWWADVLRLEIKETRRFNLDDLQSAHLFADARGEPPRLAAVLLADGKTYATDWEPPPEVLQFFEERQDGQIMGLELLAIALGLSTFSEIFKGRRVWLWSDNTGSEYGTKKGSAASWDHCCIQQCLNS